MKKILSLIVLAAAFSLGASAQSGLGSLLGGLGSDSTVGSILEGLSGVVYSAPVSLDGQYTYNGAAVSVTSSEGGILTNLAGTAVTSGIEAKVDEYLAKVGIKPGAMSFTFNASEGSFTLNVGALSLPGTFKVKDAEKVITLTFGKSMQFLSMTGVMESNSKGAKMLFTVDKAMAFVKKVAAQLGESSSEMAAIAKLADGYDNYKIGFKLSK